MDDESEVETHKEEEPDLPSEHDVVEKEEEESHQDPTTPTDQPPDTPGDIPYTEPSYSDMLTLHTPHPLPTDFSVYLNPYVLPLSLHEYWDFFFENEAPYFNRTVVNRTVGEVGRWV